MRLAFILCMCAVNSWAQSDSAAWQWSSSHELSAYMSSSHSTAAQSQAELRWLPKLQAQSNSGHSLMLQAHLAHSREAQTTAWQQAWYRINTDSSQITLGLQQFDWSVTDTISPSDALNPRDFSDITRVRKLALPALSWRWQGEHELEAVLSTGSRVAQLPQGAWAQPLPAGLSQAAARHETRQAQWALRYKTTQWGTDLSAVVHHGEAYSPTAQLGLSAAGTPHIQPVHLRQRLLALGATRQVAPSSVARLEVATFRQPQGSSFVQTVASIDHEFSTLWNKKDTLYTLLQWQQDRNTEVTHPSLPGSYDFRRLFNRQFLTRVQYKPSDSERWQFSLEASLDPKGQQGFSRISIKHRLRNSLEAELGHLHMHGQTGTFWHPYAQHQRLTLNLQWKL